MTICKREPSRVVSVEITLSESKCGKEVLVYATMCVLSIKRKLVWISSTCNIVRTSRMLY